MGEERVSEERLRHLAQHWPSEMRVVCHELIAAREELLALREQIETLTRERDEARASVKRAEQERSWRLSAGNAGRPGVPSEDESA